MQLIPVKWKGIAIQQDQLPKNRIKYISFFFYTNPFKRNTQTKIHGSDVFCLNGNHCIFISYNLSPNNILNFSNLYLKFYLSFSKYDFFFFFFYIHIQLLILFLLLLLYTELEILYTRFKGYTKYIPMTTAGAIICSLSTATNIK